MSAAHKRPPEYLDAVRFQERAPEMRRQLGDISDEAGDPDLMGLLYMFLGTYHKAA